MLSAGGETSDTPQQHGETIDLDGLPVRTVNLEGLLRTKQSMRDKDIADRVVIEHALKTLATEYRGGNIKNSISKTESGFTGEIDRMQLGNTCRCNGIRDVCWRKGTRRVEM